MATSADFLSRFQRSPLLPREENSLRVCWFVSPSGTSDNWMQCRLSRNGISLKWFRGIFLEQVYLMDLACSGNPRWFHRWASWCKSERQPLSWGQKVFINPSHIFAITLAFLCSRQLWWKWPGWLCPPFPSQSVCPAPCNPMCLRKTLRPPPDPHPRPVPRDC